MIVSRLTLKNWRNFRAVDVQFSDRVFIIGPNAAGKSNLLDALRFLRDLAKDGGGLQPAIKDRNGLSRIRCLAARREPDVEIQVELSGGADRATWIYALGIRQQVRGLRQPLLRYEKVYLNGDLILNRPDDEDRRDELRLTQTHLEQINANSRFREIVRFFDSIRYFHLVPQLLRHPQAFQGPGVPGDPFGRSFLELIAKTPEATRKARLGKIESALREAVPQLVNLADAKDEAGIPHLEAVYRHWRPNAGRQREDQFSDGTLRLIGLFWVMLDGESPLLLEEPELSLNASIVKLLPALFARMQRRSKRQVFVTSHSWDLLSDKGIGGEEAVLLEPDREGTKIRLASAVPSIRNLLDSGLSIADAALPQTAPPELRHLGLF